MIKPLAQEFADKGIDYRVALPIIQIYKDFRRRIRESISTHHIVPTDIGGSNQEHNKVKMVHRRHEWLHDYAWNEPTHQKFRVIMQDDQTALTPWFISSVDELIERFDRKKRIYKNWIWQ